MHVMPACGVHVHVHVDARVHVHDGMWCACSCRGHVHLCHHVMSCTCTCACLCAGSRTGNWRHSCLSSMKNWHALSAPTRATSHPHHPMSAHLIIVRYHIASRLPLVSSPPSIAAAHNSLLVCVCSHDVTPLKPPSWRGVRIPIAHHASIAQWHTASDSNPCRDCVSRRSEACACLCVKPLLGCNLG